MSIDTLRLTRNILLRSFVIAVIITLILGSITFLCWQIWMPIAIKWLHTDAETLTLVVLEFFTCVRFFLLYMLLTPALALHWTYRCERKKK